jgi:hypothetical protein
VYWNPKCVALSDFLGALFLWNQHWRCDECRSDDDTDIVRLTARQLVSLAADGDLNVIAFLQACFLQSDARENGDPNRGSLENVTPGLVRRDPTDGGVRGKTPMNERM